MQNKTLTLQANTVIQAFDPQEWPLEAKEVLRQMLPLTAEQLTIYLETVISSNPFLEMIYPKEVKVTQVDDEHHIVKGRAHDKGMPQSLHLYLSQQIMHDDPSPMRDVMISLIEQLDKRGYITRSYKELAQEMGVHEILMLDALNYFKRLDPAGIGAQNLKEALTIQTERDTNAPTLARYLLDEYFDKIATLSPAELAESIGVPEEEVVESISYYQTLNPAPASLFHVDDHRHLVTDYSLEYLDNETTQFTYHGEYYPMIEFNQSYYDEMNAVKGDEELETFILEQKDHYNELNQAITIYQQLMIRVPAQGMQQITTFLEDESPSSSFLNLNEIAQALNIEELWVADTLYNKNLQVEETVYSFNEWLAFVNEANDLIPLRAQEIIKKVLEKDPTASVEEIQDDLHNASFHLGDLEIETFISQLED